VFQKGNNQKMCQNLMKLLESMEDDGPHHHQANLESEATQKTNSSNKSPQNK
jgi:hypothetical protein